MLTKIAFVPQRKSSRSGGIHCEPSTCVETWILRKFWSSEDWHSAMDTEPPAVSRASHKKEGEHFKSNDQGI